MNEFAKYKIYVAAALAAATAGLSVLGYTQAAQCVTVIGGALLTALGMNAMSANRNTGDGK